MAELPRPKGLMPLERFEAILDKIARERPGLRPIIHLFNWGEPLLHPQLGPIVQAVGRRGWVSYVSTTLNIDRGLEQLVAARPSWIKVSISGDTQQDYGRTHARGQLDKVMANLRRLRSLLDEQPAQQPPIVVTLALHLYRHNQTARERLARLADELGFGFTASPAVLMPIEKNLQLTQGTADAQTRQIADALLMHPVRLSQLNRQRRSGRFDCEARFNMTAINFDGSVALCCCTFSPELNIHQDFLQSSHEQLEALKYAHPFCESCTRGGFDYSVNDVLPSVASTV
jgi:MoaA/NifB/PqqE/SkfB family radical SAM enzyme